jgi:hypothetical protein
VKGVILTEGVGSRLPPLTEIANEFEYGFVKSRWTDAGTFEAGQLLLELDNRIRT